jgi:ABC-type multidrug transport system fused ATPase/permease subunit
MQNYQKNFDGINISDIVAATTLANSLVIIFLLAAFSISELPNVLNCSKRIQEVLQINNQIMVIGPPITKFALTGDIQMTNVKFAFSEQLVLQDISFHIKKGQTLAIIGQNGSGKSTIINLLMRFFDVNDGRILIDGADIKQIPLKILRQKIGLVSQKTFLFTGKIADNIGFGVNESQKKNLVSETARHASASQFIEHLPDKYDYQVSQNSTNLSGGQKQRIAIARALSINPEILLFDDSFSALDLKTDFLVREKLQDKYHSTTKIIVAQRIGTIINADQIIVLDRGKIVAKGTHSQLLKKSKIYKDLAASQHIYA